MVPGVLANNHIGRGRMKWHQWHNNYGSSSIELNRQMLLDAQEIAKDSLRGCYFVSVSLTLWAVICIVAVTAYAISTCMLTIELRRHLKSKRLTSVLQSRRRNEVPKTPSSSIAVPDTESLVSIMLTVWEHTTTATAEEHFQFDRKIGVANSPSVAAGGHSAGGRKATLRDIIDQQIHSSLFSVKETLQDRTTSYLPPVVPSQVITKLQVSEAETVLFYFFAGIILGGLGLIGNIFYAVFNFYPAAERNNFQSAEGTAFLATSIICLIFGTMTSVSITHSTFEASFAALLHSRRRD
ncbi:hypothetical protein A4X09_0g7523 [Tilletia walkeri]|uniref:Uncharacterized protein n=1 Tax=Tilletia walkeri TaxID=117179 RepID=A0A8X7T207_9BASI|nr:hypothetical protein A4X09_0g7523 [Tilletia walkeri]